MQDDATQIDLDYLEDLVGGDTEFLAELLGTFLESAPDLVQGMVDGSARADFETVIYTAHTLKGSARSIGAGPLADASERLERAAREALIDKCLEYAGAVRHAYSALEAELVPILQSRAA